MTKRKKVIAILLTAALAVLLLAVGISKISAIRADLEAKRIESIREAVMRAAKQCYAVEGVYPDELAYLESAYGLLINHDLYIVAYDCYASNRPPKVQVLKK